MTTHLVYFYFFWSFEKMNTLTGILTAVTDILCMRCIVHAHLDTFTAHHFSTWNKKNRENISK